MSCQPAHRAADRAFALSTMETECKPLPLSLAEFLVVPLGLAVWCFALNGFPLRLARSAFSVRRWMVAAGSSTHPQRLLS